MFEINRDSFYNISQHPVGSVEKCVFRNIILWFDPFALENPPKRFGPLPSKCSTHELTNICDISVYIPTAWFERPFDFKRTARQHIRKQ